MRDGTLSGGANFLGKTFRQTISIRDDFLSEVLAQYYSTDYVPREMHGP